MRILHVSDFHYHRPWFDWLKGKAADFGAVCLTGDLLDMLDLATTDGLRPQSKWVRSWLAAWPVTTPLFVCSGNHDWWPRSEYVIDNDTEGGWLKKARRPNAVFVDGDTTKLDEYHVGCTLWAHKPEIHVPAPSIILCHAPPEGTPVSADLGREVGDAEVLQAAWELPRGSVILSGHIHSPRRWYARVNHTWCFNPGYDSSAEVPNHVVIDLSARTAVFHGWGCELGPIHLTHEPINAPGAPTSFANVTAKSGGAISICNVTNQPWRKWRIV
jgi:Icc-related predicted phosphoesterase